MQNANVSEKQQNLMRLRSNLIALAAQMANLQNMPEPCDWSGWGARPPKKLFRSASDECDKAKEQCRVWAIALREIADNL